MRLMAMIYFPRRRQHAYVKRWMATHFTSFTRRMDAISCDGIRYVVWAYDTELAAELGVKV